MNIENGWRFNTADFSVQAAGRTANAKGYVLLVRCPEDVAKWHLLPDEVKESDDAPGIYAYGEGVTIEEALVNANLAAAHAMPINI